MTLCGQIERAWRDDSKACEREDRESEAEDE